MGFNMIHLLSSRFFKVAEYIPFLSTIAGSIKLATKISGLAEKELNIISQQPSKTSDSKLLERNWRCLKNESNWRLAATFVPVLGNIAVAIMDYNEFKQIEHDKQIEHEKEKQVSLQDNNTGENGESLSVEIFIPQIEYETFGKNLNTIQGSLNEKVEGKLIQDTTDLLEQISIENPKKGFNQIEGVKNKTEIDQLDLLIFFIIKDVYYVD